MPAAPTNKTVTAVDAGKASTTAGNYIQPFNTTRLVTFQIVRIDALGNLEVGFSSEIDYERMINLNTSCFDFVVFPNKVYQKMLEDWKESDANVVTEKRNLNILNSTVEDVNGKIIKLKINFNKTEDISKGGSKQPDQLKMLVHEGCIQFSKELVYSEEHK